MSHLVTGYDSGNDYDRNDDSWPEGFAILADHVGVSPE